jgi:hypothetical protein
MKVLVAPVCFLALTGLCPADLKSELNARNKKLDTAMLARGHVRIRVFSGREVAASQDIYLPFGICLEIMENVGSTRWV